VNIQQQIPRNALVWIIASQLALVAPHAARLPIWVLLVYIMAVVWRIQVYRGRWSFPGKVVKVVMTLSGFLGVVASYGSLVGLEPTVALLLIAFALKLVELVHRKDAYVLLFLGYFICITEFLFSQDLLITLYSVFTVVLVTTSLVALHQPGEHRFNRGSLKLASVMLLQALPLMAVLFFLFPRFGPLWSVPIKNHAAKTGMSDHMKPGDVASLSQSAEVAFRVKFEGDIPPTSELYWRGLVFSKFQQGAWSGLDYYEIPAGERRHQEVATGGEPLRYSVIMEPTQQNWLYSLQYAVSASSGVMHGSDYRLFSAGPLESEHMYTVRSWPHSKVESELSPWRRKTELQLPPLGNERARQLALDLYIAADSDRKFVNGVLQHFNRENFHYTLRPGVISSKNGIDEFLFETRKGFCEHYASAFVFMMRSAGVPSRVVAGYQGGEINPVNRTVLVHQFDAHAWAEVWLAERGWVRIDPTSAVAPERIEWGLEEAMAAEGSFLADAPLSVLRFRKLPLLNQLRLRYDALTYRWQSLVVGYNRDSQFRLLHEMFGEVSSRLFVTLFLGSWLLVLAPVAISLLRRRSTHEISPLDKHYLDFCQRMDSVGLARQKGETPEHFFLRVKDELPDIEEDLQRITGLYNTLAYAGAVASPSALQDFISAVKAFKPERRRN
jgi:transglutaminase-like putative cysteine protease